MRVRVPSISIPFASFLPGPHVVSIQVPKWSCDGTFCFRLHSETIFHWPPPQRVCKTIGSLFPECSQINSNNTLFRHPKIRTTSLGGQMECNGCEGQVHERFRLRLKMILAFSSPPAFKPPESWKTRPYLGSLLIVSFKQEAIRRNLFPGFSVVNNRFYHGRFTRTRNASKNILDIQITVNCHLQKCQRPRWNQGTLWLYLLWGHIGSWENWRRPCFQRACRAQCREGNVFLDWCM